MAEVTFTTEKRKDGKIVWLWTLTAGNHQIMCNARGYSTKANAKRAFLRSRELMGRVEVD